MFNPIPREATIELKEELMSMYENKPSPIPPPYPHVIQPYSFFILYPLESVLFGVQRMVTYYKLKAFLSNLGKKPFTL